MTSRTRRAIGPGLLLVALAVVALVALLATVLAGLVNLLLSLVQEMATLKANLMHAQAAPAPAPAAAAAPDFSAAIEKLTGSLNDRIAALVPAASSRRMARNFRRVPSC